MAKKSKIAKNEQRREMVVRYAERRAELSELPGVTKASW